MKRLEIKRMEGVEASGFLKCAAGALGGYGLGALGGIEAAGAIASLVAFPPAGLMVGLAILGGVAVGIGGAMTACH